MLPSWSMIWLVGEDGDVERRIQLSVLDVEVLGGGGEADQRRHHIPVAAGDGEVQLGVLLTQFLQ